MRKTLAILAFLAACHGSSATHPDGGSLPADAPADTIAPDAPDAPGPLTAPPAFQLAGVAGQLITVPGGVTVTNTGSQPVTITGVRVRGLGIRLDPSRGGCLAVLAPGGTCTVSFTLLGGRLGATSGALDIDSDANHVTVALDAEVQAVVTVVKDGTGSGTVTGVNLDCGASCTGVEPPAVAVTLTATADAGSRFAGWSWPGCGTAATCEVVPGLLPTEVHAMFVPATGAAVLRVTRAGPAPADVAVLVNGAVTRCAAPCAIQLAVGDTAGVYASTPSTYAGMTGACTTASPTCQLQMTTDRDLAIDATLDAKELWSVALPWPVYSAHVDPQGRTVIGGDHFLLVLDGTGAPAWFVPLAAHSTQVAPDGAIYAQSAAAPLTRFAADGTVEWTAALATSADCSGVTLDRQIAVSPHGDVAIAEQGHVEVFSAHGALRWAAGPSAGDTFGCEVAFDQVAGGLFVGGVRSTDSHEVLAQLGVNGEVYPDLDTGIASTRLGGYPWVFDLDPGSAELLFGGSGVASAHVPVFVTRWGVGFDNFDDVTVDTPIAGAIIARDNGVWWAYSLAVDHPGYRLHRTAYDGSADRSVLRSPTVGAGLPPGADSAWTQILDLESGPAGGAVVAGRYRGFGLDGGFVQRFDP